MWYAVAIGAFAAVSIYAGMPLARSTRLSPRARIALTAGTMGVLLYLFSEVLSTANGILARAEASDPRTALAVAGLLAGGFALGALILPVGLAGLIGTSRPRPTREPGLGPAAAGATIASVSPLQMSMVTAIAIGIHNFSEGLAVGAAYAGGVVALSALLAFGVIAHKSAEGYCICGCDPGAARGYSLGQIALLGAIGGVPVIFGAAFGGLIGTDPEALIAVYGLASGAILSVVLVVLSGSVGRAPRALVSVAIVMGFLLAFATDLTLTYAGL